jgi:hypothetical protein
MTTAMRIRPHLLVVGAVAIVALLGIAALSGLVATRSDAQTATVPARADDPAPRRSGSAPCASCGTVESIRTVVVTTGAEGAKRTVYRITVRMDDGSYRTLSQASPPAVAVGEAVRINDGAVVRPPSQDAKG